MTLLVAFVVFISVLLIHVHYYIQRLIQINRITAKTILSDQDHDIPVSVIVCAHDEEENLRRLLPLLFRQNHRCFEVVVVSDRSNDNSYDFLLELKPHHKNLKIAKVDVTPVHINPKKYALTLGIKAAKHEHILLTDADCTPSSDDWITFMVKNYDENTQFVLGYSPYQELKGILNGFIRFETLLTGIQYIGAAKKGCPYMGVGRNLSYKKSLFVIKKGFNGYLNVTGGDDDLFVNEHANQFNTKIAVGSRVNVHSIPKQSLSAYIRQKLRHLSVGKLYKKKDKLRIGLIALSQILFWILLIVLILYRFELYYILGGYVLKLVLFTILFYQAGKRFGDKINLWLMPLFDFLWFIFYLVVGTRALFIKKVKWK